MFKKLFCKCPCKLIQEPPRIGGPSQFTLLIVIVLVALRVMIGIHFFSEGTTKLQSPNFSSVGFLQAAKGPFSGWFHGLLKDPDGRERLNYDPYAEKWDKIEIQKTLNVWTVHRDKVIKFYGYGPGQTKLAQAVAQRYEKQLRNFFLDNYEDINEYFRNLDRVAAYRQDSQRQDVDSLRGQIDKIEGELRGKRGGWLRQIDSLWSGYSQSLNDIANDEQRQKQGNQTLDLETPGSAGAYYATINPKITSGEGRIAVRDSMKLVDVDFVNWFIPRLDLYIGILLILGLFTRFTSIVAALFLCSVMATQWPWSYGAAPIHNQAVEALALVALALSGAGRFAGLDFFIVNWRNCRAACASKQSNQIKTEESSAASQQETKK